MPGSLGSLVVSLAANTAQFQSDMGRAAHQASRSMENIKREAERAAKAIGLAFAAGVGTAAVLVKQAIDSQDAILKMAQGAGIATQTFSELAFAAELAGVGMQQLATSISRLNRNISDTAAGTGEARQAFEALGIEVKNADGTLKNADQVIAEVADRFEKIEDGAGKSALAVMLFGRAGAEMIPLLNQGSEAIARAREEAVLFGAAISTEAGQAAERFNDNLTRLNTIKKGLANTIAQEVLPSLEFLTESFVRSAKEANGLQESLRGPIASMKVLATIALGVGYSFNRAIEDVVGLAAVLERFGREGVAGAKAALEDLRKSQTDSEIWFSEMIGRIWDGVASSADRAVARVQKSEAPLIQSAERAAKAQREAEKQAKDAAKAEQEFAELMAKAAMKRLQMEEEAEARATEAYERETELRQRNIENLAESLLTREEAELEAYERRAQMIQDAYDRQLITQEEAQDIAERLAAQHEKRLAAIRKSNLTDLERFNAMSWHKQTQTVLGELTALTAGVAQQSKTLFNLNKAASIAQAVINAYEGISRTLAAYPYPWNLALAAAHAVVAFAQVRAISSTSFQGGGAGTAPSLAGSTAAQPVTPVTSGTPPVLGTQGQAQPARDVTIILNGKNFDRDQVEALVVQINELGKDGFPVLFTAKSA